MAQGRRTPRWLDPKIRPGHRMRLRLCLLHLRSLYS